MLSSSSCGSNNARDSILSTYSDNDVKQVMTKIASLEEERIKLLDTIDKLHKDNQLVRLLTVPHSHLFSSPALPHSFSLPYPHFLTVSVALSVPPSLLP